MSVLDWLQQQTTNVEEMVKRFKNKEFMDAVVAGCALVAAADGSIDSSEKQKMAGFIRRSEELKVFDMNVVIKRFNEFAEGFEFDNIIGKGEALKAIGKIKKNQEAARLLIRVCCAIGAADGNFDDDEKAVVREICAELNLNPADFQL
jgi:tellurite resistance protein TerB